MVFRWFSFSFFSLFSQVRRRSMFFTCISSFYISFTLFYVCYLKVKGSSSHTAAENWQAQGFQERQYLKAVPEGSTEIHISKLHLELPIHIPCTSPLRLPYPQAFTLSIHANKTSQGLFLGTGANCPAARIQTAKPFHLPRTRCLQPSYYWGWPPASASPQTVSGRCLEKRWPVWAGAGLTA